MLRFCSVIGLCALAIAAPLASAKGAKFVVLHRFKVGKDGASPFAGLIADSAGDLYGTTIDDWGTVFRFAPDGTETTLYSFKGGADGGAPYAGLLGDSASNLYGTTNAGGSGDSGSCGGFGCGTVFRLAPDGTETVLHSFDGGTDGGAPWGAVIADGTGNLYGTTEYGGGGTNCSGNFSGCGTVFKLAPDGTETILHSFKGGRDGAYPAAGLTADGPGNFYGTTESGGKNGNGTVFKLTPDGTENVLYSFTGGADGSAPIAGLITDSAGNLYGTTFYGGRNGADNKDNGTVFRLAPDGTETVLYSFKGGKDGAHPYAGLIADGSGNLYGTTQYGGGSGNCLLGNSSGCGTVFRLAPDGTETVLYRFKDGKDGAEPIAGLLADSAGNLYGTAYYGGSKSNGGVIYEIPDAAMPVSHKQSVRQ